MDEAQGMKVLDRLDNLEEVIWHFWLARKHLQAVLQGPLAVGGQVPEPLAGVERALPALQVWALGGAGDLVH